MEARRNPFRTQNINALRYRLEGESWSSFMARLRGLNYRGAIVGPEGSGKTALLEELEKRLPDEGLVPVMVRAQHLAQGTHAVAKALAELGHEHCVLLDSAGGINWLKWLRLQKACRQAGGLIITRHSPGRLPTLIRCKTSEELLRSLSAELLSARPEDLELGEFYQAADGNIRDAFLSLYDAFASEDDVTSMRSKQASARLQ